MTTVRRAERAANAPRNCAYAIANITAFRRWNAAPLAQVWIGGAWSPTSRTPKTRIASKGLYGDGSASDSTAFEAS